MAYTKIHAIKATVDKAIDYICDGKKTEELMYVSSFGCAPETAAFDFKYTLDHCRYGGKNLAFHMIQSFYPGEVTAEEAHRIGQQLADRILEGKYSYVLSTHVDKGHIHNHVIFCAANNINYRKYYDCKETYYRIRETSDDLCREHQLSVIQASKKRGMHREEWRAEFNGTSWKSELRKDINSAIKSVSTFDEFLLVMRAKGYTIKGELFGENATKYISFLPPDGDKFVRGSERSLGAEYTKERIRERIEVEHERNRKVESKDFASRLLINVKNERYRENAGLARWAAVENLKIATQTYAEAGTLEELEHELEVKNEATKSAKKRLLQIEKRLKTYGAVLKYANQYRENRSYDMAYQKTKNPDEYFRQHEREILLFGGAKHMLEQMGVDVKSMNMKKLKSEYHQLLDKKETASLVYKNCAKESADLEKRLRNMNQYLDRKPAEQKDVPEL